MTLNIENHYKDNYWTYPEFAQHMDVFCELIDRIDSPNFGVNYDPSNALLAGEDPLELLRRVKHRVVTMHASDRYLTEGTLDDLKREEDQRRLRQTTQSWRNRSRHERLRRASSRKLSGVGFDGWISIEDGVDGFDQLRNSVTFLRGKMRRALAQEELSGLVAVD